MDEESINDHPEGVSVPLAPLGAPAGLATEPATPATSAGIDVSDADATDAEPADAGPADAEPAGVAGLTGSTSGTGSEDGPIASSNTEDGAVLAEGHAGDGGANDLNGAADGDAELVGESEDQGGVVDPPAAPPRRRSPYRRPAFAVARAVVVVVVAAVGYQAVIPQTHHVRSRLARLVVTNPGIKAFDVKPSGAAEQPASQTGLAAVVAAAKKSPSKTGVYSIDWEPSTSKAAGIVAFLLPNDAQATTALSQLRNVQFEREGL